MATGGAAGRERLDDYLRTLVARDGQFLVLKAGSPPRMHTNGQVSDLDGGPLDKATISEIASAILEPAIADRLVQRRRAEFAYGIDGVGRFRVAAFSQRGSLALQLRKVAVEPPALEDLALPTEVQLLAEKKSGLVIVAGPPGSGRTTTLHAMVDHVNRTRSAFLVTVEEPVEVLHHDLMGTVLQLEAGSDVPDVPSGARAAVRDGADVVMVGEVADSDVAEHCVSAAEAGLLVLAGLEARPGSDPTELFVALSPAEQRDRARIRLAGALAGVMSQQLLLRRGGGRVAAVEVRAATTQARERLLDGEPLGSHYDDGASEPTMERSLAALCAAGVIDLGTAMMAAPSWDALNQQLAKHGVKTTAAS